MCLFISDLVSFSIYLTLFKCLFSLVIFSKNYFQSSFYFGLRKKKFFKIQTDSRRQKCSGSLKSG